MIIRRLAITSVSVLALSSAVGVYAAAGATGHARAAGGAADVVSSGGAAPVIHEKFTPMPCHPATTIGQEGCAEHSLLRSDAKVNAIVKKLFGEIDAPSRHDLVKAQTAWLAYRKAACTSESDAYRGGSQQPVLFAECEADITKARFTELQAQDHIVNQ